MWNIARRSTRSTWNIRLARNLHVKIVLALSQGFRYTLFMFDGEANNGGNVEEYPCDVCGEEPAQVWCEDNGAVCKTCRKVAEKKK